MTLKPFIKGNYTLVWSILLYLIGVYFTLQHSSEIATNAGKGFLFSEAGQWINHPWFSAIVNSLFILSGGILLLRLNNHFSIIPKRTLLPIIFFFLFEMASPQLSFLCNGNLIAVVMTTILLLLFSSYQQEQPQSAFLIMGAISLCSLFCPPAIYFVPLLLVGFIQIRYFNLKSILGALVGLITPFWILLGVGVLTFTDLAQLLPAFTLKIPETLPYTQPQFWIIVLTVILGAFSGVTTIYSTFNEKRQIRAYNGFISLLSIYTTILLLIDHIHYATYLPLLNMTVALQAAFFFTNNTKRVGIILFYLVLTLYIGLFVWNFLPT